MKYLYSIPGMAGAEYEEATYTGEWKAGKREGRGEMTWVDGARFRGKWKGDMRAEGEMVLADELTPLLHACEQIRFGGLRPTRFALEELLHSSEEVLSRLAPDAPGIEEAAA